MRGGGDLLSRLRGSVGIAADGARDAPAVLYYSLLRDAYTAHPAGRSEAHAACHARTAHPRKQRAQPPNPATHIKVC